MKTAVLFDLGNTLVRYYTRPEFPFVLEQCLAEAAKVLTPQGLLHVPPEDLAQRAARENYESPDHRVRPLEDRLMRVFGLDADALPASVIPEMCRAFVEPIFQRGSVYPEVTHALGELRSAGFRTAIVSNTSWGSPADLWRQEVTRRGLSGLLDAVVFCRDAGWRKPARALFALAMNRVQADPQECLFVGDDPRWDLAGAQAARIDAVLIDRTKARRGGSENVISDLDQLLIRLPRRRD